MISEISPESLNKSLEILRNKFAENQQLAESVKLYETEGIKRADSFGDIDLNFNYVDFIEIRKKGFLSPVLAQLFEMMMYIHYFDHLCNYDIDLREYVNFDLFNKEKFDTEIVAAIPVITATNVIRNYAKDILSGMKIDTANEIFADEKSTLNALKVIEKAMSTKLYPFGDHAFLLSKIPIGGTCKVNIHLPVIDQIFYTYKPEHIIDMARVVKPGIYTIANVPYGRIPETAFYILFRFEEGAYLVETCKHSYRDQHYRRKTDGTSGEEAWLDNRYKDTFLPIEVVLEYFDKKSTGKDITLPGTDQSFRTLGNISDSDPLNILWINAFIDKCMQIFQDDKLKISTAMSMEFILPELEKTNSRVPAIYQEHVPSISTMNLEWNPTKVEVEGGFATYLEPYLTKPELDKNIIPTGKLVPVEHIKRELIFRQRMQSAEILEKKLTKDFKKNWETVIKKVGNFIMSKDSMSLVKKALLNERYPMTRYAEFTKSFDGNRSKFDQVQILYSNYLNTEATSHSGYGVDRCESIIYPKDPFIQKHRCPWGDERDIIIGDDHSTPAFRRRCVCCNKRFGRYHYTVQFLDYLQFESFFELSDAEKKPLPSQLKDFLNQERTCYFGNSILDDVDPITSIHNPWWTDTIDHGEISELHHDTPALFFSFNICKFCKNKLEK